MDGTVSGKLTGEELKALVDFEIEVQSLNHLNITAENYDNYKKFKEEFRQI
ncbi:hypothetical protein [Bacillus sp. M6-12]|uniref:hypothetical protein n=1 Tax=Bacillus sp. M6-12 TaxID=2054166 RepID=UPI0015E09327|nr:hypothetical protein [Bacillus sp. M6-12]